MSIQKIISGGQTGVDQAALQFAIDHGIEHGGWCPPGRVCEDGVIPPTFDLKETPHECDPSAPNIPRSQRTIWNVRDADGLLVFQEDLRGILHQVRDHGTELAIKMAQKLGKPYLIADICKPASISEIQIWLSNHKIEIMNVAGPSDGNSPRIYEKCYTFMTLSFEETNENRRTANSI